ncbi:hypothetical protein EYV94_10690 [Puteibacter caeruleilacunae]|nr:hypothetical protein EYV94_10690 [Puteibacter caeruleilacunae]
MSTKQKIILGIAGIVLAALFLEYLYLYMPYTFGTFVLAGIPVFSIYYHRAEGTKKYRRALIFMAVIALFLSILMVFPELNYLINDYQSLQ